MLPYTQDYNDAIRAADRRMRGYIRFNGDDAKVIRDTDGLVSFTAHQDAMQQERFCIGSVCAAYCDATFYNEYIPAGVSLANAYFDAFIGATLPDNSIEYKCVGRFYISEVSRGAATTQVVGYDVANRLSVEYTPTVTAGPSGYEVIDILNDIIDQTQVNGGVHFTTTGAGIYIPQIVAGACRDQWGWLMTLCSDYGEVSFGSRTEADLGYIEQRSYENGKNQYTLYPAIDDTVTYMDGFNGGEAFTVNSLTTGTEETPIVCGSGVGIEDYNPYITADHAADIFANLNGVTYMPMTLRFRGDPCIELMDSIKVSHGTDDYRLVCMRITTTFNGGLEQTLECWGDTEAYYAMSQGTLERKVRQNSTMLSEMAEAIENADNGVITKILDTDGSWKELVIANNQDLSQATSVWRFNINGLAHANRYQGGTYTLAMDTQGRIVASVIQTGILQDAAGKNSWNLDTGALTITDGSVNITTDDASWDFIKLAYASQTATDGAEMSPSVVQVSHQAHTSPSPDYYTRHTAAGFGGYKDGVTRFFLSNFGGGLVIYDANGTMRASFTESGINQNDANGNLASVVGGGSIILYDGGTMRVGLGRNNLSFYDATGNLTGFIGNNCKDYVIEQGTINSWTYRKWNSGLCECWYRFPEQTYNFTPWGTVYYCTIPAVAYPFEFASAPNEIPSTYGNNSAWYGKVDGNSTTMSWGYECYRPVSGNASVGIEIYVVGMLP